MPLQDFLQLRFIQPRLLQHLFNAHLVLDATEAGGNGQDMFGAENFCRHTFVINALSLAHGFLGQAVRSEELQGESAHQKMFALDLPALRLQMRVDGGDTGGQTLVGGDEKQSAS